jgi:hypothetical protein
MIGTKRRKIVGFPAHGVSKKKASAIATENASGDHAGHNKELEREYLARERYIR